MTLQQQIARNRLVPVIVLHDAQHALPLAHALLEGGLPVAEVTFRTPAAEASIKAMASIPNMLVGAGTVLTVEQVHKARDAGATFLVTPGTNPPVIEEALKLNLPIFPGVMTPTEIDLASTFGLTTLKFFPAQQAGGAPMLKALHGPYPHIQFIPTGNITPELAPSYLALSNVLAVGGSWMVQPDLYKQNNFHPLTQAVRKAVQAAQPSTPLNPLDVATDGRR